MNFFNLTEQPITIKSVNLKKTSNYEILLKITDLENKIDSYHIEVNEHLKQIKTSDIHESSYSHFKSFLQTKFYELYHQLSANFLNIFNKIALIQEDQYYIKHEFLSSINKMAKESSSTQLNNYLNKDHLNKEHTELCDKILTISKELDNATLCLHQLQTLIKNYTN